MGYEYGRKVHASIDTDSLSIMNWKITTTLKEILEIEHIWYVRNRNYDISVGEIIVAYNCTLMSNKISERTGRKIIHIVSWRMFGHATDIIKIFR